MTRPLTAAVLLLVSFHRSILMTKLHLCVPNMQGSEIYNLAQGLGEAFEGQWSELLETRGEPPAKKLKEEPKEKVRWQWSRRAGVESEVWS